MKSGTKVVGAYEAKTHLSSLLDEVARGKEIVITRRERPIARLVPINFEPVGREDLFARIRAFRLRHALPKGETTRDLVQAGRRL